MPSVGSTPTTTSPSAAVASTSSTLTQQNNMMSQHSKLQQQQHSLPLQTQYYHRQPMVTTTQPSAAGALINQAANIITTANKSIMGMGLSSDGDISPLSSTNSFSSIDTNQTLLNSIANQTHQQHSSLHNGNATSTATGNRSGNNRSYNTKYSQYMIITPAVSIDRDCEHEQAIGSSGSNTVNGTANVNVTATADSTEDDPYIMNNGNIFRMSLLQSSIDSGNSSDSSFHSNYNPYIHSSRQHLLPKSTPHFYTFSSWRWCTLICAAMRCFGGGHNSNASYSSSFARPPYQRSCSSNGYTSSMPHHRLRSSSFTAETAFEHFSAPFKPRKTRDHLNNITYEL